MSERGEDEDAERLHRLRRALHRATLQLEVAVLSGGQEAPEPALEALEKVRLALADASAEVAALVPEGPEYG